jgi:hypothetical protein
MTHRGAPDRSARALARAQVSRLVIYDVTEPDRPGYPLSYGFI